MEKDFGQVLSLTKKGAKLFQVEEDKFSSWRWQLKNQVQTLADAERIIKIFPAESAGFTQLDSLFHAGVTPYYMSLMQDKEDCPIRLQALPNVHEKFDLAGVKDPLSEVPHSPVPEVVHVYPDRVAFCVALLCPVYCRYCFRKRRDEQEGLHFNRLIIERGLEYIKSQKAIRDVLITGGDPFLASDESLVQLVARIREIPHVEIIRFGTRTPVTLPYRVTAELAKKLQPYHPIWVNTHFNCVEEITPEAKEAIANLVDHGFPVGNQAVLLKGVNDSEAKMLSLCQALLKIRVRPYYVFHAHQVAGSQHLRVSLDRGLQIMKSLRGNLTGFGIPVFAVDTPSGKIPLEYNYSLKREDGDLLLEDIRGEIWREKNAFF
ncbi:MAG: KamA family radical SAM protein [Oligoflexales bacterium]|nr:KamA family radical SAM protein [Oligoflexales bacterium]